MDHGPVRGRPSGAGRRGHRHPAGVLRRRRQRRPRRPTPSAARTTPDSRSDRADPGYGVQPEFDDDFAWQYGYRTPIIAAVNGAAAGIGLALALFCDLRFASAPAKITTAAPKLGLPAEYGMSWVLPRLVGVTRAADLLLSGRILTAAETADWGLWNEVLADGESALAAAHALRTPARDHGRAGRRHDDQTSALPRPPPPRRGGVGQRLEAAARRGDAHGRVPRGDRRAPRPTTTALRPLESLLVAVGSAEGPGDTGAPPVRWPNHARAPNTGELVIAGIASGAAGLIHLAAWGAHADTTTLAVLFVVLAIAQLEVAVAGLVRPNNLTASALALVNLVAAAGWIIDPLRRDLLDRRAAAGRGPRPRRHHRRHPRGCRRRRRGIVLRDP